MSVKRKRGYVMLTVLCVFALLSAFGFTLLTASLANAQSARRKLASAQADAYAVSLAGAVNAMVEAGRFTALADGWRAEFLRPEVLGGRDSVFLPSGTRHPVSADDIPVGDPAADSVRFSADFYYTGITVRRDPADPGKSTCSGTLEADMTVACVRDGREVSFQFHSAFDPDGAGGWKLRGFEKRRDYVETH